MWKKGCANFSSSVDVCHDMRLFLCEMMINSMKDCVLCLDGYLNATVFMRGEEVCALGRMKQGGALAICRVFPQVRHLATLEQPNGHMLEDPRYLGFYDECDHFLCADAIEFFESRGDHTIYQAILSITRDNEVRDVWRVCTPGLQQVEKNWAPVGQLDDKGRCSLLYSHDTLRCATLDCAQRRVQLEEAPPPLPERSLRGVRGGTPLLALPEGAGWWGLGHRTEGSHTHPHGGYPCPKYITTAHHYSPDLRQVVREQELSPAMRGLIEYACGACDLGAGRVVVALGWNDLSTLVVCADLASWWDRDTVVEVDQRLSYLPGRIPRPLPPGPKSPTLCLNMIVKNESRIMPRIIQTVLPIIDSYCICDTGSTDGTPQLIQDLFKKAGVQGRVVHQPFYTFGYNRSFALRAAQDLADYVLLLDADMKLVVSPSFRKESLTADVYTLEQGNADFSYKNVRILSTRLGATCVGSTHEYYGYPGTATVEFLPTLRIDDVGDGGCKQDKFARDIRLLQEDLRLNPKNDRAHFYLANTYRDTQQWDKAIEHYEERVKLGGWYEEVWYSRYALGKCHREKGDMPRAIQVWLEAYQQHPLRAENIYEIVVHYRETGQSELAARFYQWAAAIPEPQDSLFIHHDIYKYKLAYEFMVFYYYLKDKSAFPPQAIHQALYTLLAHNYQVHNVLANYKFYAPSLENSATYNRLTLPKAMTTAQNYVPSTPSSVRMPNGDLVLNVRFNNTTMDAQWNYVMSEDREVTYNAWMRVKKKGKIQSCGIMGEKAVPGADPAVCFQGRQDVRLFLHQHQVLYTATVCTMEEGRKVFRIEHGVYDLENHVMKGRVMRSPTGAECEKNWCLFRTTHNTVGCVYSWHPLVVGRLEEDQFVEERRMDVPVLRLARGSSHGVICGEEVWFLVHLVSYESPRRYYHAVVVMDRNVTQVRRVSHPFTLEGQPIEYCGDMAVKGGDLKRKLCLHYSVRDQDSSRMEFPEAALSWHRS